MNIGYDGIPASYLGRGDQTRESPDFREYFGKVLLVGVDYSLRHPSVNKRPEHNLVEYLH